MDREFFHSSYCTEGLLGSVLLVYQLLCLEGLNTGHSLHVRTPHRSYSHQNILAQRR